MSIVRPPSAKLPLKPAPFDRSRLNQPYGAVTAAVCIAARIATQLGAASSGADASTMAPESCGSVASTPASSIGVAAPSGAPASNVAGSAVAELHGPHVGVAGVLVAHVVVT